MSVCGYRLKCRVSAFIKLSRLAAVAALGLVGAGQSVQAGATLASFGAAAGDDFLPRCDDCSLAQSWVAKGPANTTLSMPLFAKSWNGLFVNNNGNVSFGAAIASYTGTPFPDPLHANTPVIAPFFADVDTRAAQTDPITGAATNRVWTRTTQDAVQLNTLAQDIRSGMSGVPVFNPTFAQVVTWDKVGYYAFGTDLVNTFQATIVTDGAQTYAVFKYPVGGIKWFRGTASPTTARPIIGFDAGDALNYASVPNVVYCAMVFPAPPCDTLAGTLPTLTNTVNNSAGTFIFRLDQNNIGTSPAVNGVRPANFALTTSNWNAGNGGSGNFAESLGRSWAFGGTAGTVNLGVGANVLMRMKVDTSGYVFTGNAAAGVNSSLQIGQLLVPTAATTVTFGGSMVLLTNENSAGLVWNGTAYEQRGALTLGQINFTDNTVLAARGAGMVNGADVHLQKSAKLLVYTAGATTGASTLSFDATGGGNGGTLDLRGFSTTIGALSSLTSGAGLVTNSGSGAATLAINTAGTGSFSGVIQNGTNVLSLVKSGAGTQALAGANTYTGGTTLAGGVLALDHAGAIGSSGTISFTGGALRSSAANTTDYSARFSTAAGQQVKLDTNGQGLTLATDLTSTGGTLTKLGAGTLTLTGANTYTGGTTISGGTLQIGNGGHIGAITGNVVNNGTLAFNRSDDLTFGGAVSGAGGLSKSGAGTLTLSGAQTYAGATAVQRGTLRLNGSATSSAFTVDAGATLGGNASIGALQVGGTLAPGNSPGLLGAGATTFLGGGRYLWEINNGNGAAGIGYDLLSVTGTLTVAANAANPFTISLVSLLGDNTAGAVANFNARLNHSYTLVSTTGGIVDFSADRFSLDLGGFANDLQGGHWSLAKTGNDLNLTFTAAVPEPASALLLALGLGGLALRQRSRSQSAA